MNVETVPIDTLRPYPDNPRAGDTDVIVESIRENGLYRPLVVSSDSVVLAGNHTYFALAELGHEEVPIVRLEVAADSEAARRIVLVDNRSSDLAKYDDGTLVSLLATLESLEGTGYSTDDFDDLVARLEEMNDVPLDLSTVTHEPTLLDRAAEYAANGRRLIVLDYDQSTYRIVTEALAERRERYEVASNADVLLRMIEE